MSHSSNGATGLTQVNLVNGASPDSGESHADTVIAESGWNRFFCLSQRAEDDGDESASLP